MAETLRSQQLKSLTYPSASPDIQRGMEQARMIQLQAEIGKMAPGSAPTTSTIQQVGAAQTAGAGQAQVAGQQAGQQRQTQVAKLGLSEQESANRKMLAAKQRAISAEGRRLQGELFSLGEGFKQELFDKQMQFNRDEAGRTLFNERQLADYAISNARSQADLQRYEQQVRQLTDRKLQMLDIAQKKIAQVLKQGYDEDRQELTQKTRADLAIAAAELKKKIAKEKARAANRASVISTATGIAGAAAGAYFGGPQGAMAGYQAGSGLGQTYAGATA